MSRPRAHASAGPTSEDDQVERFHRVLVESIQDGAPAYLDGTFTVAEIYQSLVPYRTHRDRLGLEMNGDYEDTLLRLLAGEGDFVILQSEPARDRIRKELKSRSPNTGLYREFAAAEVRLNPDRMPSEGERAQKGGRGSSDIESNGNGAPAPARGAEGVAAQPGEGAKEQALRCPDCGEPLPERDSLQFCPFCGANTREVPCRKCGEMLERSWRFCVACGTPSGD